MGGRTVTLAERLAKAAAAHEHNAKVGACSTTVEELAHVGALLREASAALAAAPAAVEGTDALTSESRATLNPEQLFGDASRRHAQRLREWAKRGASLNAGLAADLRECAGWLDGTSPIGYPATNHNRPAADLRRYLYRCECGKEFGITGRPSHPVRCPHCGACEGGDDGEGLGR